MSTDDPIQQDASEVSNDNANETTASEQTREVGRPEDPMTARANRMSALVDKHNDTMGNEARAFTDWQAKEAGIDIDAQNAQQNSVVEEEEADLDDEQEFTSPDNASDDGESAHESTPEAASKPVDDLPFYQNNAGEYVMKLKVNGQEREVPMEQVKANLQKIEAGDERLRQAAEWEKNLQQQQALINQRVQEFEQSSQNRLSTDAGLSEEQRVKAKTLLEAIWDGSESAADQLAELLEGRSQPVPTLDANQIADQAMSRMEQKQRAQQFESDRKAGVEKFSEAYPEIVKDNNLWAQTDRLTIDLQREHPDWTPTEILMEAGKQTRSWLQSLGGGTAAPANNADRIAAKQNLKPIPNRQAQVAKAPPKAPVRENSPASVIQRMKAQRASYSR